MEAGQIGLCNQIVVLRVVEEYNRIQGCVQIHHQMKSGRLVLECRTISKLAMRTFVQVSLAEKCEI